MLLHCHRVHQGIRKEIFNGCRCLLNQEMIDGIRDMQQNNMRCKCRSVKAKQAMKRQRDISYTIETVWPLEPKEFNNTMQLCKDVTWMWTDNVGSFGVRYLSQALAGTCTYCIYDEMEDKLPLETSVMLVY